MGYGNPLFDGDEPLPPQDREPRILSLRLWRRRVTHPPDEHVSRHTDRASHETGRARDVAGGQAPTRERRPG